MIDKAYLEISNICNLNCSFCHGTKRPRRMITEEEFEALTDRLAGEVKFLYFHLLGEPLLHPSFSHFVRRAWEKGLVLPAKMRESSMASTPSASQDV